MGADVRAPSGGHHDTLLQAAGQLVAGERPLEGGVIVAVKPGALSPLDRGPVGVVHVRARRQQGRPHLRLAEVGVAVQRPVLAVLRANCDVATLGVGSRRALQPQTPTGQQQGIAPAIGELHQVAQAQVAVLVHIVNGEDGERVRPHPLLPQDGHRPPVVVVAKDQHVHVAVQ